MNNENNNLNGTVLGGSEPVNPTPNMNNGPAMGSENLGAVGPTPGPAEPAPGMTPPVGGPNPMPASPEAPSMGVPGPSANEVPPAPAPVGAEPSAPNPGAPVGVNPAPASPMPNAAPGMPAPAPVTPEPAYTNPATINPAPMPGFENSIGTTPPINLEPEKQPKKKTNKIAFIFIVLIILAGVGFGTFCVLKYTNLLNKPESITILTKEVQLSINGELSSNNEDYAEVTGTDINNCSLDTSNVDATKAGNYTFTITCGDMRKEGTITVTDDAELEVTPITVYKTLKDTLSPEEFFEDADDTLKFEFVDEESVKKLLESEAGSHEVKIKVTGENDKTAEVVAKLIISEYKIKGYLVCSSKEEDVSNAHGAYAKKVEAIRFGIADISGTNGNDFANLALQDYSFKFNDKSEFERLQEEYKTEKTITVEDMTGDVSFDEETSTITFTNMLDSKDLESKYGKDNIAKYSTIKSYFETQLSYSCVYKKVETPATGQN